MISSNRAVVDEQGKTLQSTDYYPYGMPYLKEFGNQLKEFVLRRNIKFVA
ncbi:unknown [Prevotella sp. CAG:1092]|nr:unknown [Prevotella sp. CAG:1092]